MREIPAEKVRRKIELVNPHWQKGEIDSDIKRLKRRKYFDPFYPLVAKSKVRRAVVLMGPRRVGKTVLLRQTIQNLLDDKVDAKKILYLSLDDPVFHAYSLEDMIEFYKDIFSLKKLDGRVILFDEIQYLKGWDIQLKVLVDTYAKTRFVVSGSAASALKRKSEESGAGRFTDFLLPPLTFNEYLDLLGLLSDLEKVEIDKLNQHFINYINYGGFPEAVFDKEIQKDPQRFIRGDIIDKVLLRDLPSLYGIHDTQELNRLFMALVYQTGNEVSLDGLSKASGVAKNTIKKYLEYLEAAFLIRRVRRIDDSGKIFKRDNFFKIYLCNPSMYAAVYGPVSENDTDILGGLVETAIFSQWMHSQEMKRLYYARWQGGKGEVDMVSLNENSKVESCVEIKWSDKDLDAKNLRSITDFCRKNKIKKLYITTKTKTYVREGEVVLRFMPSAIICFIFGEQAITDKRSDIEKAFHQ
jgi:hypothetical protein